MQHFVDQLKLALWEPNGGNVSVGEASFEAGFHCLVVGTGDDGVVVRKGVGSDILGNLGKSLNGAIVAQAATEEEKAEAGVEAFQKLRNGPVVVILPSSP